MFSGILQGTPWWVYVIFVLLVSIGFRSLKPRQVSLRQLIALPLIFTLWNFAWLSERIHGHYLLISFWIVGIAVGMFVGMVMVRSWAIHVVHEHVILPKTWSTIILIAIIFIARYFFLYNYEMHPEAGFHLFWSDALVTGCITGIFIGRSLKIYSKYRKIL